MKATSAEIEIHGTLTPEEEIHCHKARIFSLLAKCPVIRAWQDAICDGAVYLGKRHLPTPYADRYFQTSSDDIHHVTFSIVTAFEETVFDAEGQEIERSQCHVSPAQREASEFLIVTFSNDYDKIALLPHRLYWPVEGDESAEKEGALPDEISGSTLSAYCFSITLLSANIDEIRRITLNPMHPTTTLFRIGLDGRIPRAGTPEAIMPQVSKQDVTESVQSILASPKGEERALRTIHDQFTKWGSSMNIDFLDYQPLLRDFKIVVSSGEEFPNGLEAVINHSVGSLSTLNKDNSHHLRYADYLLSHSITRYPNYASFNPRRLITEAWFEVPRPHETRPAELYDSGRRVWNREFLFEMDDAGKWVKEVWKIICKYPPEESPTSAEKMQEIWKKRLPWPEIKAQIPLPKDSSPQEARTDEKKFLPKRDSGTGDNDAAKPSDASLILAHYMEKASLGHNEAEDDAI